jgi:hypothetical protein
MRWRRCQQIADERNFHHELKGEIMYRLLLMTIAVPALAMFGTSETASAQHYHNNHGCAYGGSYGYSAPAYSHAPVYRSAYIQPAYQAAYVQPVYAQPVYRSAYVQPSYGISIGIGRTYSSGYYGGRGVNYGRSYGGHHHHHHHH